MSVLYFVKRVFSTLDEDYFTKVFRTFVRPELEFAMQAWRPWTAKDLSILEKAQGHTMKLVAGQGSVLYETRLTHRYSCRKSWTNGGHQGEKPKVTTKAEEVFSSLRDGSHVAIQGVASTPDPLIRDFCEYVHARNLKNVHIYTTLPFGEGLFVKEPYASHFKTTFFFLGSVGRKEVNSGKVDYAPMFLNEVPRFYRRKLIDLDMCIINVSAPDAHGNYSMGPSIKTVLGAVETAKCLVGQVNPLTPFTYGDSLLHESRFKYLVPKSMPMHTLPLPKAGTEEGSIGKLIAENLIDDGSTLQMGIGSIPDIVLSLLHSHKNLGIHTEMFSDGIIDLCETGVITNALKKLYRGFIVSSFILGSERVFSFVDKNSDLIMKDVQWTNAPEIIAQNPKVVAINSCIEVSLAGHVASDSIGPRIYSG
nr:unnamed protein product [Spirometra erinaceieuropaei]